MALHEQVGATDEWYTPACVFEAMGVRFDFDPCPAIFVPFKQAPPAYDWCDRKEWVDGLSITWSGFVWLNPPFGPRNGIAPWFEKFFEHGDGVALVPDRTSAPWWQRLARKADAVLFVSPKLKFIGADGKEGTSPAQGTCLLAAGGRGVQAVRNAERNGLGLLLTRPQ